MFAVPVINFEIKEAAKRRIEFKKIYKILNREQALTESAENKIKRIIQFIHENYTSDISREGLASAVDMNHNYMSRLFYRHTGKKVNEYINDLRIKKAVDLLKNPSNGVKIIDIALKVGFEN